MLMEIHAGLLHLGIDAISALISGSKVDVEGLLELGKKAKTLANSELSDSANEILLSIVESVDVEDDISITTASKMLDILINMGECDG